jgi:hypothetical protein
MIAALPNGLGSVTQVADGFGVERTLAWKMVRVAQAPDPLTVPQHLPGGRAMARLFRAAAGAGIDAALISQAKVAFERFHALTDTLADDRASLGLIIGGQASQGRRDMDLAQRRAAYRANAYLLGASAAVLYDSTFLKRSAGAPTQLDVVGIRGYTGLNCMRSDVAWPIARRLATQHPDGQVERLGEPLIPRDAADGVPVLRRFCSTSLPALIAEPSSEGYVRFSLRPPEVGKRGAVDVFLGERYEKVTPAFVTPGAPNHVLGVQVRTPCRYAVIDQFLHRDTFGPVRPSLFALSMTFGQPDLEATQFRRGMLIPLFEDVSTLGPAHLTAAPRGVPDYREMSELAAAAFGVPLAEFDLYRVVLEYAPHPTLIVMSHPLPERP